MLEIILPCPNCQTSLLVDEQNAGTDVLCPGCEAQLKLPRDLSGAVQPELKRTETGARKNHPLHRTGHLMSLPDEPEAGPAPEPHHTHLPERRGLSAEEEMRRMAALTAEPVSFDLHNVNTKGQTAFPCPACHRPVWITGAEWGQVLVCAGCSSSIIAPEPGSGAPARLAETESAVEPRQKTVLPARRQVEDLGVGEQPAAGRPKRQGGQLPPAREAATAPAPQAAERSKTKAPAREPIPARGDVELSSAMRKGPPLRRTVTAVQEQSAVAAEFESSRAEQPAGEIPAGRIVQRSHGERVPNFTPKHEADLSAETAGQWGGTAPQEQSVVFRRTLTIAILTLLVGAILVTAFMLRSYFAPPDLVTEDPAAEESPVQNVDWAKAAIERYFAAQTVEDMAKEVRHPELTLPRMKAWYARTGLPRQKAEVTDDWREQDNFQGRGVNFIFTVVKVDGLKSLPVALEVFNDGRLPKLDWEHFVSWSETPWSEFLRTTSERPAEFRVAVTPLPYYNGHYTDERRYLCFRVSDRENFGSCYAYCESNSNLAKLLLKAVREAYQTGLPDRVYTETGEGIAHVILRLRFLPEGQQFNQASIEELIWNDWLEP